MSPRDKQGLARFWTAFLVLSGNVAWANISTDKWWTWLVILILFMASSMWAISNIEAVKDYNASRKSDTL